MRKYLSSLLLLSFIVSGTMLLASAESLAEPAFDRCPRHKVQTELKAKKKKTIFERGSLKSINDYLGVHGGNGIVLAFVDNRPFFIDTSYRFSTKYIGHGKMCIMLDKVKARLYSQPRIVMPSDFKKSSCEYKILLEHEKRHLNEHQKFFDENKKKYQVYLGHIARDVPVFPPVTTPQEAAAVELEIMKYFDTQFDIQVTKSIKELMVRQRKIDSPQEYTFNTTRKLDRCSEKENDGQNRKIITTHDEGYQ